MVHTVKVYTGDTTFIVDIYPVGKGTSPANAIKAAQEMGPVGCIGTVIASRPV